MRRSILLLSCSSRRSPPRSRMPRAPTRRSAPTSWSSSGTAAPQRSSAPRAGETVEQAIARVPRAARRGVGRPQPGRAHDAGRTRPAAGTWPNDPGPSGQPGGWKLTQWNFYGPGVGERRRGVGQRREGRPHRRAGHGRRRARHRRRLPQRRPLQALAGLRPPPTSCAATTSSAARQPPGRRERPRHARRRHDRRGRQQRRRPDRPRLRREDHAGPRARLDRRGRRPGHRARRPLRRAPRRRRHQPVARVLARGHRRRHPRAAQRDPLRARRAASWSSARRATRGTPPSPTRRARGDVLAVGATTERGCLVGLLQRGPRAWTSSRRAAAATRSRPSASPAATPRCPAAPIVQLTYTSGLGVFGYPDSYEGTSMAAPHVAAAAALVIASGVVGRTRPPRPSRSASRRPRATSARRATTSATAGACSTRAPPPPPRLALDADDEHRAGRVVRDLVRHGAEQEAVRARHALVAHHDQIRAALLGDVEQRGRRVALARVGRHLDARGRDLLRRLSQRRARPRPGG